MTVIQASDIPVISLLYKLGKLPATSQSHGGPSQLPVPSKALNDRIGLLRGDITTLAVDAIVNAANKYLRGGGGVDGAIHRAAGPGLLKECKTLNGCRTGGAKITKAYNLPCKKVIHAVGPVYDVLASDISEGLLTSCYSESLKLAAENGCKSIAFSAISTGVYGYPSGEAASAAIGAVRKFLEKDTAGKIEKVVFVTFEKKDVDAYNEFLPQYFPPVPESGTDQNSEAAPTGQSDAIDEAEAEKVASELPSVPKSDPADPEHVDKKQK